MIDFDKLAECISQIDKKDDFKDEKIENVNCTDPSKMSKEDIEKLELIAKNIISNGKYAVVTMAGGQRNKTRHR